MCEVGGVDIWRSIPNAQSAPPRRSFHVCVALLAGDILAPRNVVGAGRAEYQVHLQH